MKKSRKRIFWSWLPVLLWLGIIAFESSGVMSSHNTGSMLYSVVTAIFGPIDNHKFETFHALLRKAGHFSGYAILSLLFFRALVRSLSHSAATAAYAAFAAFSVAFTFVIASLDEWHQSFLPSRTGAFTDVLLDTFGAVAVQALVLVVLSRRETKLFTRDVASVQAAERGTCASSISAATTASPADK